MLPSRDKKSNSNTRRGDNSKSKKKPKVSFLYVMSSGPVLHYYQVSSKYSKECSTYIVDTKSIHIQCQIYQKETTPKVRKAVVILVHNMSSGPVLHFCQVPSKYSKGYSSYRADTKSFSNKTKGDNSKSWKARVVNLVCDTSSHPDLHFYQVSSKYSKGFVDKKF